MTICNIHCTLSYKIIQSTDIILQIQVAQHAGQCLIEEQLRIDPALNWREFQDAVHHNRHIRLQALPCEHLKIEYHARVEKYPMAVPDHFKELSIAELPDEVLPYLLPSRYCDSDRLKGFVQRSFYYMTPGYSRLKTIEQWIYDYIYYESGSTDAMTMASDVLVQRAGVCRDFAHLGIAICRALGIAARMVVGYVEIEKFSPDFHAIFEAYLDGGWVLFDATRLAPVENLVRIATGIDAGDVAFASFYGQMELLHKIGRAHV